MPVEVFVGCTCQIIQEQPHIGFTRYWGICMRSDGTTMQWGPFDVVVHADNSVLAQQEALAGAQAECEGSASPHPPQPAPPPPPPREPQPPAPAPRPGEPSYWWWGSNYADLETQQQLRQLPNDTEASSDLNSQLRQRFPESPRKNEQWDVATSIELPKPSYWICTLPRSGSEVLSLLLIDTGRAGKPREFYGRPFQNRYEKTRGVISDYGGYFVNVKALGSTDNGVFAAKLFWPQYQNVARNFVNYRGREYSTRQILDIVLPNHKYVHLQRLDKLRQAISFYRASLTKQWRSVDRALPGARLEFNFDEISNCKNKLEEWSKCWEEFFQTEGISPYNIVYEHMINDFDRTLQGLLAFLDLPVDEVEILPRPRLDRQSDNITDEWVELFMTESSMRDSKDK